MKSSVKKENVPDAIAELDKLKEQLEKARLHKNQGLILFLRSNLNQKKIVEDTGRKICETTRSTSKETTV